jgi:copper chaperone
MHEFQVDDMTCGHCSSAISNAVKSVDPAADVQVDLGAHRVKVSATSVRPGDIAKAIEAAGYAPTLLPPAAVNTGGESAPGMAARSCCGCCR